MNDFGDHAIELGCKSKPQRVRGLTNDCAYNMWVAMTEGDGTGRNKKILHFGAGIHAENLCKIVFWIQGPFCPHKSGIGSH